MIQNLDPYDILATGSVTRWHTLRTARPQTLAEHKARVALTAVWLAYRLPVGRFSALDELELLRISLLHDIPETRFGDVPNPAKQALNRLEVMDYDRLVDGVFWESRNAANPMLTASALPLKLLRVADMVEAAAFFYMEGLTNQRPGCSDLRTSILREALRVVVVELPELSPAVLEFLAAAEVPQSVLVRLEREAVA